MFGVQVLNKTLIQKLPWWVGSHSKKSQGLKIITLIPSLMICNPRSLTQRNHHTEEINFQLLREKFLKLILIHRDLVNTWLIALLDSIWTKMQLIVCFQCWTLATLFNQLKLVGKKSRIIVESRDIADFCSWIPLALYQQILEVIILRITLRSWAVRIFPISLKLTNWSLLNPAAHPKGDLNKILIWVFPKMISRCPKLLKRIVNHQGFKVSAKLIKWMWCSKRIIKI